MEKRRAGWWSVSCSCESKFFNGDQYTYTYSATASCGSWPSPTRGSKSKWSASTSALTWAGKTVKALPSLKTNPATLTMSGFSSGGFKTAYIFNQWASKFRGVGIFSGAIGDLTVDKAVRLAGTRDWMSWR